MVQKVTRETAEALLSLPKGRFKNIMIDAESRGKLLVNIDYDLTATILFGMADIIAELRGEVSRLKRKKN